MYEFIILCIIIIDFNFNFCIYKKLGKHGDYFTCADRFNPGKLVNHKVLIII